MRLGLLTGTLALATLLALVCAPAVVDAAPKDGKAQGQKQNEPDEKAQRPKDKAHEKRGELDEKVRRLKDKADEKRGELDEKVRRLKDKAHERLGEKGEDRHDESAEVGDSDGTSDKRARQAAKLRDRHRKMARNLLSKRYGMDLLKDAAVQAELRRHGRTTARLERILELANDAKREAIAKRVERVVKKEELRHEKRMRLLTREKGGK